MEGGYVSREPTYTNTQAKCDRGAAAHVQTSKSVLYDMFSTQLANSKSSVISGSGWFSHFYPCKLRVKLLIEAQKLM